MIRALGNKSAALIANHGVVGVGAGIMDALHVCQIVEKSARVYVISKMIGSPISLSHDDVTYLRETYQKNYGQDK